MQLNNVRIRTRLWVTFGALASMVLVIAATGLIQLKNANDGFAEYLSGVNARALTAERLRNAINRRAIATRNLVLLTKPEEAAAEKALVMAAHADIQANLKMLQEMVAQASNETEKSSSLVAEMEKIEKSYGQVAMNIVEFAGRSRRNEAIGMVIEECRPLLAAMAKVSAEYAEYTEGRAQQLSLEASAVYAMQLKLLVGICIAALGLTVGAGVLITRSITRPIDRAVELAQAVSAGDMTVSIQLDGKDELSVLLAALAHMNSNLTDIVSQVRQSSDSIATGSAQIASGNSDLSHRTEQQATVLQQTAASMEQLNSKVKLNASSAQQANQLALGASSVAAQGGEVVNQVVTTMKAINDSSKRISDIISVIDSIAFQTNILALNAAVEAARAGEQGRGFAVVASEVRSLAGRSADAAKEIKTLINASVERVDQGTAQVDEAGKTMEQVVAAIKRVTDIMGQISAASVEQSAGVEQVGQAVAEMDQTTQQNAALVEESAAAAESLKQQADQLVSAVSVFKLTVR